MGSGKREMGPDPTGADTSEPDLIMDQPDFDLSIFIPNPIRFFCPERKKVEKFGIFWRNFPDLEVANPTRATKK